MADEEKVVWHTAIPDTLEERKHVTHLTLGGNDLTALPSELWDCTALEVLYLYNNNLNSLPREIGQLTALNTLSLHTNNLTSLPPEIGCLTALKVLYLYNNKLNRFDYTIETMRERWVEYRAVQDAAVVAALYLVRDYPTAVAKLVCKQLY